MKKDSAFKRIWLPSFVFLGLLGISFFGKGFLGDFGLEAVEQSKRILAMAVQIGIWLSAAIFVNRLVAVFLWDGLVARATGGPVPKLMRDVVSIVIFLTAASGILAFVFGKSVAGIWATSGVIGLVIGLAIQSIILDLFVGLAMNVERPFKIGDYISVHPRDPENSVFGKVIEINWRTTRILTTEDNVVLFPNSLIGTTMVTNVSQPTPPRRLSIEITVDPTVPVERARRVLLAGAMAVCDEKGLVNDPAPVVLVAETNEVGIEYNIRFYSQIGTGKSKDRVLTSVLEHLRQAGIGLGYPKQDVFHAEMPERMVDAHSKEGLVELLHRIPLFDPLSPEDLDILANDMSRRFFTAEEAIIRMGDSGDSMFVLVEGLLEVFAIAGEEGNEIRVAQIVPGKFFGEMSVLTGEPRSATVKALTDSVAYEITKDNISRLLATRPSLAEEISQVVAQRRANSASFSRANKEEQIEQTASLAGQILGKMKNFFKGALSKD